MLIGSKRDFKLKRYELIFQIVFRGDYNSRFYNTITEAKLFVYNNFFVEMGYSYQMYDHKFERFFDLWNYDPPVVEEVVDWVKEGF